MGCRFSSTKPKQAPAPPPKSSLKAEKPSTLTEAAPDHSSPKDPSRPGAAGSPDTISPHSPVKHPYATELAATDDNALDDDLSNNFSPNGTRKGEPPIEENDDDEENGGSGMDLNGSFANVDLNGSFHIHYNTKGDIIPNATLPESRRGRSVSPKLLLALSPHPSDDDLVLVCTDCGMTIDENCEQMCPLTGKLHI